jgi:hypothetical protein
MCALPRWLSPMFAGGEEEEYVKIPASVFRNALSQSLVDLARPPTSKHAGKRLRSTAPIPFPAQLLSDELAVHRGFPESSSEVGIERNEAGEVQPTKVTAAAEVTALKLQAPALVKALARFGNRLPSRGMGSTVLQLSKAAEKRGKKAKKACLLAGPVLLRQSEPRGIAKSKKIGSITMKANVVMVDENGDVTFGVKDYPAWVRRCCGVEPGDPAVLPPGPLAVPCPSHAPD